MAEPTGVPATQPSVSWWCAIPSLNETAVLYLVSALLFVFTIVAFTRYGDAVSNFGDSPDCTAIASAIRHWDFHELELKQFWGYPYAIATVSIITRLSEQNSLLLVSFACSLASIVLAYRLWGGWIAGLFAVLNFDWMQRSFLGGSEPLFVILLFASFWAAREKHWVLAAGLASLATVTRPVGILALVSIGAILLVKREYRALSLCAAVGFVVGLLYLLPFWAYFHDPFYQIHRYRTDDWHSASAIGIPFYAIVASIAGHQVPWTNLLLNVGWIVFTLLGTFAMTRKAMRQYAFEHSTEFLFTFLYITFLFTYNSREWAYAEFPRFVIPVIPLLLFSLQEWIPKSRLALYAVGIISPILAAASALGIRNVAHALLR